MDVDSQWHWVKITLKEKPGSETIRIIRWDKMPFEVRTKWNWYFKYRAARLQVENPRCCVEICWGHEPITSLATLERNWKKQVAVRKAKVTLIENKLEKARQHWDSLFPIESDALYIKCLAKLDRVRYDYEEILNNPPAHLRTPQLYA